jgi:tetratricopeptide (TPR) repeat protein
MKIISAIFYACCCALTVFGQQLTLQGTLKTDGQVSVPTTRISVAGFENTTDTQGRFKLVLSVNFREGERVIIKVVKPGWLINQPVDGEWNLPNLQLQNVQPLEVVIVPRGSKKLWTHARIEKYVAKLSDEITKLKKKGSTPRPADFSFYLSQWADQFGFTPEQVKAAFDEWSKAVEHSEDFRQLGLRAFYQNNFAVAAINFDKAARKGEEQVKQVQKQLESGTLETYENWKQAGNSYNNLFHFREALDRYLKAQYLISKEKYPEQWGEILNLTGDAQSSLGEREEPIVSRQFLAEAVKSYREALTVYTRAQASLDWAWTQNNLGTALRRQGERTAGAAGTRLLTDAAAAYREALSVYSRQQSPLDWADAQNNLGSTLLRQGERTAGNAGVKLLDEAVAAYIDASLVYTREHSAQGWAVTQNNLGLALQTQGERTEGTAGAKLLVEAVAAYRAALSVYTRESSPQQWAMTQNNLGIAQRTQGKRAEGAASAKLLAEAVTAYREALRVYTREQLPQQWAMTQNNLGLALQTQGERIAGDTGATLLAEAVAAYREALRIYTRELLPQQWATTQNNLGSALQRQGERTKDASRQQLLNEAVSAFRQALEIREPYYFSLDWMLTQNNLASAYYALQDWSKAAEIYRQVVMIYPDSRHEFHRASHLYQEKLFDFAADFELKRRWLETHPDDLSVRADFTESHFTTGQFAKCREQIAMLLARPDLAAEKKRALQLIEVASLLALGQTAQVPTKLDALIEAIAMQPADFDIGRTFNGSLHFIGNQERLTAYHDWLRRLFGTTQAANRDAIVKGLREAKASFKW